MKSLIKNIDRKAMARAFVGLASLIICMNASGNDGKQPSVAVKGSVPVTYYEGFMVAIALIYGVYLIIRAKRRKRNSRISQ